LLADHLSRDTRKLSAVLAENFFRGDALASVRLVLATTLTGWLFASFRSWSLFYRIKTPWQFSDRRLASDCGMGSADNNRRSCRRSLRHIFIYRDRIMHPDAAKELVDVTRGFLSPRASLKGTPAWIGLGSGT
jgi:hypothetical protein